MRWNRMHVLLQADQRPKQNHKDAILPAHPQELYLLGRELGPTMNTQYYSPTDYSVSKKLTTLLRHGSLPREDDGARWWSDWILEIKRFSSEPFCVFSTLVWWKVEKHNGKRRRKQEKISVLYWFFRSKSVPPSSSRSFWTQSHWILHHKTMYQLRTISSSTLITLDVQPIYIPS